MWHFVEKFAEYCAESFLIVGKIGLPTASNKQGSQEKSKVEKEQKSPKHFWKSRDLAEPWDVDLSPSFIISRSPSIEKLTLDSFEHIVYKNILIFWNIARILKGGGK